MFFGFNSTVTGVEEWSKIWIGEAIEPDKVVWLDINDPNFWRVPLGAVTIDTFTF